MKIGLHVSAHGQELADGLLNTLEQDGMAAVQIFAGAPMNFHPRSYLPPRYEGQMAVVVHAPYVINLGNPAPPAISGAIGLVDWACALGAHYVVIHAGSSKTLPAQQGVDNYRRTLDLLIRRADDRLVVLVENGARGVYGVSGSLGSVQTVATIIKGFYPHAAICLDFAHAWANAEELDLICLTPKREIPVVHANVADFKVARGSHLDRHGCRPNDGAYPFLRVARWLWGLKPEVAVIESEQTTMDDVRLLADLIKEVPDGVH